MPAISLPLVSLRNANSWMYILISGHTDDVGKNTDNLELSQRRANAVMEFIATREIRAARVTAKGYGETRPIAPNATERGRQMNRRVEFTIMKE